MTVTIRDLEANFKTLGFSSRRSKAGAAAAWKVLSGEDEPLPTQSEASAELDNFAALLAAQLGRES